MRLENEFTVAAPVERAWEVMLDVERVAPCLPGAAIESSVGDEHVGTMAIKLGPITSRYRGTVRVLEADTARRRAVMRAQARDERGQGTAAATITSTMEPAAGGGTRVRVETEMQVSGPAAQFGRGVMQEVSAKLMRRFAEHLAEEIAADDAAAAAAAGSSAAAAGSSAAGAADSSAAHSRPGAAGSSAAGAAHPRAGAADSSAAAAAQPRAGAGGAPPEWVPSGTAGILLPPGPAAAAVEAMVQARAGASGPPSRSAAAPPAADDVASRHRPAAADDVAPRRRPAEEVLDLGAIGRTAVLKRAIPLAAAIAALAALLAYLRRRAG